MVFKECMGPTWPLKSASADVMLDNSKAEIEQRYPFINLPEKWVGLYAPDNGCINVQQLCRSLYRLAQSYGAHTHQYVAVTKIQPYELHGRKVWEVLATHQDGHSVNHLAEKIVIACGAYTNHVVYPSFGFHLNLDIWEMVSTYFSVNAGPKGTIFRSKTLFVSILQKDHLLTRSSGMWFQFANDNEEGRSQLFYGFPVLPWGPQNVTRISVDAATNRINDPSKRQNSVINAADIEDTRKFVRDHIKGVDSTVPAFSLSCLQTNVFDNMFVLDFVPKEYLHGGAENSVAIFTAGWAMKFIPLLGVALSEMMLKGESKYKLDNFSIVRKSADGAKSVISPGPVPDEDVHTMNMKASAHSQRPQAGGSSMRMTASVL